MEKEPETQTGLDNIITALSESETRVILQVIQRDEQLRMRDQFRVMKLKKDLQALRRKSALKSLLDADVSQERSCARCRKELGRIINRGALCRACRLRVCKACRELGNRTTEWVCCVCQKNMELQAATGEWMNEFVKRPSKRRDEKSYVPAADVIKRTIRRSWTISNSASLRRKETQNFRNMKPYRSLPLRTNSDESMLGKEKHNFEKSLMSGDEDSKKRRENIMKAKSKSLNTSEKSNEHEEDHSTEVIRTNSDRKNRYKTQKMKMKIKRQASLEEQFPFTSGEKETQDVKEEVSKNQEKKFSFLEDLKIPKIEIIRKNSVGESFKGMKEYGITSPNSSKLRERFSKSRLLKQDSKNLSVELSKSSDSGIGVSRSTEDESIKTSESVIFKFFDIGPETRLNKSDSERSPNFLDTVSLFTRSRSHERSVSSDSSDKNLSDLDKPSIKIRKRHEYSESRDSSSSYEGNIFDTHISNRVRKLHEVALKQMSEESAKNQKLDTQKRTVDFKYPVEFGSYDNIPSKTNKISKVRKFKSLERTYSNNPATNRKGESFESDEKNSSGDGLTKSKCRLKKQDRFEKRLSLKDKRNSLSKDSSLSGDRRKEKRYRGFLKNRKDVGEDESDENVEGRTESRDEDLEKKDESSKRLSRKDKKVQKKPKRALSEEHRGSRERSSMLFSIAGGKRRSDSETRHERREMPEEDQTNESETSEKIYETTPEVCRHRQEFPDIKKTFNSTWATPKKIFSAYKQRTDLLTPKPDFAEIRSYLEVVGKILPMSDEYKIVFISSDSSTKENRSISSDSDSESSESETDSSKKLVSDCDWDYFEPSSLVRPVVKDWNWYGSPKSLSGTLFERASPVFSTSDDNSPKFPRRGLGKFSIRDSPISCEMDLNGFSPDLRRKITELDSSKFPEADPPEKFSPVTNTDMNEDSHIEEVEIEVTDLKASPPIKNKEVPMTKESVESELVLEHSPVELKQSEEMKKQKKKRKNRKSKKGTTKDDDLEGLDETKKSASEIESGEKGANVVEEEVLDALVRDPMPEEKREEVEVNTNAPSDGLNTVDLPSTVESVDKPDFEVVQSKLDGSLVKDSFGKSKSKSKKQKNKKKGEKRAKCDSGTEVLSVLTPESGDVDANTKTTEETDEFTFQAGNFGFQSQNIVSSQTQLPDVFSYNRPISSVLQNNNAFQNFIPIPVPVPIPVPFPVPTAIWAQNYQNFFFPNFSFSSENFKLFNNLQNIYSSNYLNQNLGNPSRNDSKDVSFKAEESNSNGTGNGSIHIRPINMQRPTLAIGPLPSWNQGSENSAVSDPTCLANQQSPDKASVAITKESVVKINDKEDDILIDEEKIKNVRNKKCKRNKKKSRSLTDQNGSLELSENGVKGESVVDMVVNKASDEINSDKPEELGLSDIFVEGKTFREVKHILKHKNELECLKPKFLPVDTVGEIIAANDNKRSVIKVDETVTCELIESSLLNIDKKSVCSSTSQSEDSDGDQKPFKKSYYFNLESGERKTSDDSDIADLSSPEEETKSDEVNSSQADSIASEDEGNPDSKFSEIYVINRSESEIDLTDINEKSSEPKGRSMKFEEMIPVTAFPVLNDLVVLKHVKKLSEDDAEVCLTNSQSAAEKGERPEIHAEIPESVHNSQKAGEQHEIRSEDSVILVSHLAEPKSTCASVAHSEIEPRSLTVTALDNNISEPVFSEIDSVPRNFIDKSEEVCTGLGEKSGLTGSEIIVKDLAEENYDREKNSLGGDVSCNAESEVNNGELVEESNSSNVVIESEGLEKPDSGILAESKQDQYGLSFLDKIESRIRHFSQLGSIRVPPQGNETKYTSLVMITQDKNEKSKSENSLEKVNSVKVITNNTTKVLNSESLEHFNDEICLKHTNRKNEDDEFNKSKLKSLEDYYTMTLENSRGLTFSPKKPNIIKNMTPLKEEDEVEGDLREEVQVVTDDKTLSAVICLEEGLADDDSWVEDLEKDRENDFVSTITEEESSSGDETNIGACIPIHTDREEELRGYHRGAINFTLHTIVEESCEESEVEDKTKSVVAKKQRPTSATDLEKYFYFDIGGGVNPSFENQDLDTFSESSSSIYSDGGEIDDANGEPREVSDQNQLSTSRLEKYFLNFDRDGREKESDGSVGSDSEGPPSPEQRRKRLFRARASNRLHSSSLDNLVQSENEQQSIDIILDSEDSSTETDMPDSQNIDKSDDSVKRKKQKRKISGGNLNVPLVIQEGSDKKMLDVEGGVKECRESLTREHRHRETKEEVKENHELDDKNYDNESDDERSKTPQPDFGLESGMCRDKQQSRDSGFVGSCDDLLKDQKTGGDSSGSDTKNKRAESLEKVSAEVNETENLSPSVNRQSSGLIALTPPATGLTRKDSFNNWSSDEETNLMMSKMRQFFKAMVSVPKTSNKVPENSNPSSPQVKTKGVKPPQLVYFENELTRLMKTVPGIRDDQVREIVEYLSSEDTWSDSYDSSDYTSSDLEGTAVYYQRSQLQQEISESCKQIIDNFDQSKGDQEQKPKVPPRRNSSPMNRETAFVYHKLVASFNKITNENENASSSPHGSPPLFAKIMHHIGSRLVALMHEVSSNSSGEGSISSHKSRYHKRISQKLSNVSSTTEEECGLTDESDYKTEDPGFPGQNMPYFQLLHQLPRSKSHDLLLEEAKVKSLRSSSSGVSDIAEEKEASDYERFSWRGSFESALMADSRSKLTLLSNDTHSSNTALAAKRRSAGDLLFLKSLSREQLDRVRSCGSIGGVSMEDKNIWTTGRERNGRRRSSVPDAASPGSGASADGDEDSSDSEIIQERSITLPRSLQSIASCQNTNSLPRLPTTGAINTQNLSKAQSVQHFLPNAKSARYRPPGFSRVVASSPKRAVSAPGLQVPQSSHARRERRRNQNFQVNNPSLSVDELSILEASTTPHVHGGSKSASPSPIVGSARSRLRRGPSSVGSPEWSATDEIQRLVAFDQQRQSSSSLGARSDSMASVYSGAGEGRSCSIPVKGEVEFGLQYNYKAGDLEIYVKQCKDLAAVDTKRNRSDPYVKVYLLPDKSKSGKRKTKVKKHTLNPVFDEVLKFHISLSGLETRTLWLTVWHSDMFGRNDFLGEVMMSLENKVFDDPTPQSYLLQERTEPFEDILSYKGEIIIGLKFIPPDASTLQKKGKRSKGTLNVRVKEAKNLTAVKSNGVSDPFCKSYLLPDKGRNSKQKTPVQRRTCNPFWNHTFIYEDVSLQELSERCLELTVWDHDRLASNEFLGGLRFSLGSGKHYGKPVDWMDSTGKEVSLWQSMLEKPNLWVEGCLPLRASLDPPNTIS